MEQEDVCDLVEVGDASDFHQFVADGGNGVRVTAEAYGSGNERVLKPDAGDFVKWLRTTYPELPVEVEQGRKLALHSSDVWIPLVFLAKDIALPVYLNMVSSYLYTRFRSLLRGDTHRVHLSAEFIDAKTGSVKRFTFAGETPRR